MGLGVGAGVGLCCDGTNKNVECCMTREKFSRSQVIYTYLGVGGGVSPTNVGRLVGGGVKLNVGALVGLGYNKL